MTTTSKKKLQDRLFLAGIACSVAGGILGYFTPEIIIGLAVVATAIVLFGLAFLVSCKRPAE